MRSLERADALAFGAQVDWLYALDPERLDDGLVLHPAMLAGCRVLLCRAIPDVG